jgi:hypothetical protein
VVLVIRREFEDQIRDPDAAVLQNGSPSNTLIRTSPSCEGFCVREGAHSPGTAHASLQAPSPRDLPFAVIIADVFYGADSYARWLTSTIPRAPTTTRPLLPRCYKLGTRSPITETVSRGVCRIGTDNTWNHKRKGKNPRRDQGTPMRNRRDTWDSLLRTPPSR